MKTKTYTQHHMHPGNHQTVRKDGNGTNKIKGGGVMLLIHTSLNFNEIPVNFKLEAVAAMISTNDKNIIIYNIYNILTDDRLQDDENLVKDINTPYVICGDFNSHNEIWGSKTTNRKRKIL